MITYVNTVLVGKGTPSVVTDPTAANAGKYIIMDLTEGATKLYISAAEAANASEIKIGLITSKTTKDMKGNSVPVIKWSNNIKKADIKSYHIDSFDATKANDIEDKVELDFTGATMTELQKGNKRVLVRLTFKDTPTRYRKWTDTYEYVTAVGDNAAAVAKGLADIINKEWKRSRVTASAANGKLTITALPYDDNDTVDSINWDAKVRFSANAYYTDPEAAGFASKNKYSINGLVITKTPGYSYKATGKLVRDREAQAMGYEGILNRGEGTWPIIKPEMQADVTKNYDVITLEFENMYRAADDIFRKTKQTVEIYDEDLDSSAIKTALDNFVGKEAIDDTPAAAAAGGEGGEGGN